VKTLPALQAEWDRSEKAHDSLIHSQWNIIQENISQIAALVDGLTILRHEVGILKNEHSEKFDDVYSQFRTFVSHDEFGKSIHEHKAGIQERVSFLEQALGESADSHARQQQEQQEQQAMLQQHADRLAESHRNEDHTRGVQQRLEYLEKFVGDSLEKVDQATEESSKRIGELHGHRSSLEDRLLYIEKYLGDSEESHDAHAKEIEAARLKFDDLSQSTKNLDAAHGAALAKLSDLHASHDAQHKHHADVVERIDYLEKMLGESADKHADEISAAHSKLEEMYRMTHSKFDEMHGHFNGSMKDEALLRDKSLATVEERIKYFEDLMNGASDGHNQRFDDLHNKHEAAFQRLHEFDRLCQELKGHVGDDKVTRDEYQQVCEKKLECLENMCGQQDDRHGKFSETIDVIHRRFERFEEVHGNLQSESDAREQHHATLFQRMDYLEKLIGDNADKHSKELEAAHHKLTATRDKLDEASQMMDASHGKIDGFHGDLQAKIDGLHSSFMAGQDGFQESHHSIGERLAYLERLMGDSADLHEETKKTMNDAHQKLAEIHGHIQGEKQDVQNSITGWREQHERHSATLEQRVEYVENQIGSSADENRKSFEDLQMLSSKFDEHMSTSRREAEERHAQLQNVHVTLDERVEFLESKVCDSEGKYAKEVEMANRIAGMQREMASRVDAVTKEIHDCSAAHSGNDGSSERPRYSSPPREGGFAPSPPSAAITERAKFDPAARTMDELAKIKTRLGQTPPVTPPVVSNTGGSGFGSAGRLRGGAAGSYDRMSTSAAGNPGGLLGSASGFRHGQASATNGATPLPAAVAATAASSAGRFSSPMTSTPAADTKRVTDLGNKA
jgi:chromosome segregation ATPase